MTNNPSKVAGTDGYGLEIINVGEASTKPQVYNRGYLDKAPKRRPRYSAVE